MSPSFRDALHQAARAEPAVGDPYARFLRRRRRSRGLRVLFGLVLACVTLVGFIRIFPGTTGLAPDDGFFPGGQPEPGYEEYQEFSSQALGFEMLVPRTWRTQETATVARTFDPARSFVIQLGELPGCATKPCTPLPDVLEDADAIAAHELDVRESRLRIGSLPRTVTEIRFPRTQSTAVAPWCSGCIAFYAELGSHDLPLLILTRAEALQRSADLFEKVLATIHVP